ncbi:hypothetical protein WKK05_33290 [Nostoc sp. UHCC 0302]|uniref:hypothetical protein n=1 Tax=Nostoc sp. UHCC 0302 TaxID=3134896 RepID=UPI00311CDC1C
MKVIDHKDAINRRLYNNQSFVETAIYRVSSLNRTYWVHPVEATGVRRLERGFLNVLLKCKFFFVPMVLELLEDIALKFLLLRKFHKKIWELSD